MASETCEYKNQFGDECGNPAPFFYVTAERTKAWRCTLHDLLVPKTGDPIPGMIEPPRGDDPRLVGSFTAVLEQAQAVGALPDDSLKPWPTERGQLASSPVGVKFDSEKVRHDLLSVPAIEGLSRVLTYGAAKYEAHNWRKGIAWSRVQAALLRHMLAFMEGEDIDPESGLPHIDHVMCNAMFLSEFQKTGNGEDDRWRVGK